MKGTYTLDDLCKSQVKEIIVAVIEYINNHEDAGYDGVSLNPVDVSPSQVIDILREMGYTDDNADFNGWEGDAWWTFSKPDARSIILSYCGYEFSMSISLQEPDEEDE
ncbi:MAG: hypothetical protein NC218_09160 [Acetobacter sp.]|nr:hypothetical protein [Acetobacter sp.]